MSTEVGQRAELAAAEYLERKGFKILDRNLRTKRYEIDIVATRDSQVHIVEVKFRLRPDFGYGFEYVTPSKQARLAKAAQALAAERGYECYQIDVISVDRDLTEITYLPNVVTG